MIEIIHGLPSNTVGFRATGQVDKEDYDHIVLPEIRKQVELSGELNYVFVIETPLSKFSAGAWIQDAWLGVKEIAKWHKVAIVSDDEKIRQFTDTASHFLPGEYRGFTLDELPVAIQWASSLVEVIGNSFPRE